MAKQKEVLEKCKEFKIKIQKMKKQNISLKTAKRKISDILRLDNYVPFTHSVGLEQHGCPSSSEPSTGQILGAPKRSLQFTATQTQLLSVPFFRSQFHRLGT